MDPSAAPWRALETPAPSPAAPEPTASPVPRSMPLTAVLAGAGAIGLVVVAFFVAMGAGGGELHVAGGAPLGLESQRPGSNDSSGEVLVVEIAGAVVRPGVYRLPAGSRVTDLVELAGGYGARVDVNLASAAINLAAVLEDGAKIRVPSRDDPAGPASSLAPPGSTTGALVDLNTATATELEALPGVGPATSAKIIAARDEQPFASIDELRGRGILGEKTFEKLRELVTAR